MRTDPKQLALYVGAIALPVVIIIVLLLKLIPNNDNDDTSPPDVEQAQSAVDVQPTSTVATVTSDAPPEENQTVASEQPATTAQPDTKKIVDSKAGKIDGKKAGDQAKRAVAQSKTVKSTARNVKANKGNTVLATEAYISVACQEGTQVFLDGKDKGKLASTAMTLAVPPGSHKVIVASKSGSLHTQNIQSELGKTVSVKPSFCG